MSSFTACCDICKAESAVPSYGDWQCSQCGQKYEYDECYRISLTKAQWALLRNPPKWIPVSERLPDDETELLVAFDDRSLGVAFAVFHHLDESEGPKWTDGNGVELKQPTHWMSLPEPPEGT